MSKRASHRQFSSSGLDVDSCKLTEEVLFAELIEAELLLTALFQLNDKLTTVEVLMENRQKLVQSMLNNQVRKSQLWNERGVRRL